MGMGIIFLSYKFILKLQTFLSTLIQIREFLSTCWFHLGNVFHHVLWWGLWKWQRVYFFQELSIGLSGVEAKSITNQSLEQGPQVSTYSMDMVINVYHDMVQIKPIQDRNFVPFPQQGESSLLKNLKTVVEPWRNMKGSFKWKSLCFHLRIMEFPLDMIQFWVVSHL